MKLNKREKVLTWLLIIILIAFASYKFIIAFNLFNIEAIRTEFSQKTDDYNNMKQNIVLKSTYETKLQALMEEMDNLNVLSDMQQENVIVFLDKYLVNNNINANNISFTDATIVPMDSHLITKKSKDISLLQSMMDDINNGILNNPRIDDVESAKLVDNQNLQQDALTVKSMTVNITFESIYENLMKFIGAIQNHSYDITITNISIVSVASEEGNIIQGNMVLKLYEVPKLDTYTEQN